MNSFSQGQAQKRGSLAKWLTLGCLLAAAVAVRDTWLPLIALLGVVPDLLLYFPVLAAMYAPPGQAACYGAALGLLEDLLSGKYPGLSVLCRSGAALAASFLGSRLYKENLYHPALIMLVCCLVSGALYIFCSYFVGLRLPWSLFVVRTLPQAVYTALLTPLVWGAVCFFKNRNRRF